MQTLDLVRESPTYEIKTYEGVEIRVRSVFSPVSGLWQGTYSFIPRTIPGSRSERVVGKNTQKFATEGEAIAFAFTCGQKAVDQEIQVAKITRRGSISRCKNGGDS